MFVVTQDGGGVVFVDVGWLLHVVISSFPRSIFVFVHKFFVVCFNVIVSQVTFVEAGTVAADVFVGVFFDFIVGIVVEAVIYVVVEEIVVVVAADGSVEDMGC